MHAIRCLVVVLALSVCGCAGLRDLNYQLAGIDPAAVKQAERQLLERDAEIDALRAQRQDAQNRAAALAGELETRTRIVHQLQQQLASVAQQLAAVDPGPTWDALSAVLDRLRQQLAEATQQRDATQIAIDRYNDLANQTARAIQTGRRDLRAIELELQGYDEQARAAIMQTSDGIRDLGDTVQDFGVPGASTVTEQIATWAQRLGLAGLAGGVWYQRRKRKDAERDKQGLAETVRVSPVDETKLSDEAKKAVARAKANI